MITSRPMKVIVADFFGNGIREREPERDEEESDAENNDMNSFLPDNLNIGFANLPSAALAQTTSDKITLDTDAAGHGWFIDYTQYLNEEWLPTSNPCEWQRFGGRREKTYHVCPAGSKKLAAALEGLPV
jgi:hypothetical protein